MRRVVRLSLMGVALYGGPMQTGWAQELPEGKGKEIVQNVCSQCHGLNAVATSRMSKEDWENTVLDMVARGAPLLDEEIDTVVQYLSSNLGKQAAATVNVNKASAKELETSLKLTAEEAREVIGYRSQNGNFTKLEDFQKVPGLDIKKLEAAKDRLEF
jgi:competence protein ComEA